VLREKQLLMSRPVSMMAMICPSPWMPRSCSGVGPEEEPDCSERYEISLAHRDGDQASQQFAHCMKNAIRRIIPLMRCRLWRRRQRLRLMRVERGVASALHIALLIIAISAAAQPRPIGDAERAAVSVVAAYLANGPDAVYERLADDAPLRALPRADTLREIEARMGPRDDVHGRCGPRIAMRRFVWCGRAGMRMGC
jgi:hypothetical protein